MPDGGELTLNEHVSEFAILLDGQSLMSSRMHHSEDALATIGCRLAKSVAWSKLNVVGLSTTNRLNVVSSHPRF